MRHTPGPWTREEGERFRHDQSAGIRSANGMYVATALDFNQVDRDEEVEANARLIAAATELLEACEAAARSCHHPTCSWGKTGAGTICNCHVKMAKAAVTKANQT